MPNGIDYQPPPGAPVALPSPGLNTTTFSGTTEVRPPAQYEAAEQFRQQLNAMRFREGQQQQAINAWLAYQRIRAYESEMAKSGDQMKAFSASAAFMPPNTVPGIIRETRPVPPFEVLTNVPGAPPGTAILKHGRLGQTGTVISKPEQAGIQPEIRTVKDPSTGKDVSVMRIGPNSWQRISEEKITPSLQRSLINDEIRSLEDSLDMLSDPFRKASLSKEEKASSEQRAKDIRSQLETLRKQRSSLRGGSATAPDQPTAAIPPAPAAPLSPTALPTPEQRAAAPRSITQETQVTPTRTAPPAQPVVLPKDRNQWQVNQPYIANVKGTNAVVIWDGEKFIKLR